MRTEEVKQKLKHIYISHSERKRLERRKTQSMSSNAQPKFANIRHSNPVTSPLKTILKTLNIVTKESDPVVVTP